MTKPTQATLDAMQRVNARAFKRPQLTNGPSRPGRPAKSANQKANEKARKKMTIAEAQTGKTVDELHQDQVDLKKAFYRRLRKQQRQRRQEGKAAS